MAMLIPLTHPRIDVIDLASGDIRGSIDVRNPWSARFSPDGSLVAVAGDDGVIQVHDTQTWTETNRLVGLRGAADEILIAPDDSRLVAAQPNQMRAWDISPSGPQALGGFQVPGGRLDRLVISADESVAYATMFPLNGSSSSVHRVDVRTGADDELLRDIPYFYSTRPLLSPDQSKVAVLNDKDVSELVQLPDGGSTTFEPCASVRAFNTTGRVAAVNGQIVCWERPHPGYRETNSRIVDLETGETLIDFGPRSVYMAAFGPVSSDGVPGSAIVEDHESGEVTLYDLATGKARGTYVPDDFPIWLAMSPDGSRAALLLFHGDLVELDLAKFVSGKDQSAAVVFDHPAHASGTHSVAISKSGLIASASSLDGIRVWSPDGRQVAYVATRQPDRPTFNFAPGTDTLYYEDDNGVVRRFPINVDEITRLARSVLTREFTPQECDLYFPGEECPTFDV
jgi:WD40 repeat protein